MTVLDVSQLLLAPPTEATGPHTLGEGLEARWQVLKVTAGDRWQSASLPRGAEVLMLEGSATGSSGEVRETLGSGHLMIVPPDAIFSLDNDGRDTVWALYRIPQVAHEDSPKEDNE